MSHEEVVHHLYSSFEAKDPDGMAICYHPDVKFTDPVFGCISSDDVMAMWRMLINRGGDDLSISHHDVQVSSNTGSARWEAVYTFRLTGREIHNRITARFKFEDGRIIEHKDSFNLYQWTVMAFGWKGGLFGWTPFFKGKIRKTAAKGLREWKIKHQGRI